MLREKSQWHPHFDANFPQEEELLQEVEQLMDRDAPPDTLGVEILLIFGFRTSLRAPTILGVRWCSKSSQPKTRGYSKSTQIWSQIGHLSAFCLEFQNFSWHGKVHPGFEKVMWVALLIFWSHFHRIHGIPLVKSSTIPTFPNLGLLNAPLSWNTPCIMPQTSEFKMFDGNTKHHNTSWHAPPQASYIPIGGWNPSIVGTCRNPNCSSLNSPSTITCNNAKLECLNPKPYHPYPQISSLFFDKFLYVFGASKENFKAWFDDQRRCEIETPTQRGQAGPILAQWQLSFRGELQANGYDRRKFRSQTSDNMDRWKAE